MRGRLSHGKCNLVCLSRTAALLALGTLQRRKTRRGEGEGVGPAIKDPQTPQMGFQSVLICSSPWGLLSSLVMRLWRRWHPPRPSCFTLCIASALDNPYLRHWARRAPRTMHRNENRERRSQRSTSCLLAAPLYWLEETVTVDKPLICLFFFYICLCRLMWESIRRNESLLPDPFSVSYLFPLRARAVFLFSLPVCRTLKVISSALPTVRLLYPFIPRPRVWHEYPLSRLQFHALEPLYPARLMTFKRANIDSR